MTFDPWLELQRHEARSRQTLENTARLAQAFAFYDTHGWGEFQFDTCHEFDLTFIEQPVVAYGYAIDGDQLVDKRFPRAWGGVYRWKQDTRGFYTGAWCFVVVDTRSPETIADMPTAIPDYDLDHSFTFTGVAMKDLPTDLLDN